MDEEKIMSNTWAQKAEENIELFTNTGKGAEAARMLEITPSNRILIDRDQAVILQVCRLAQNRFMSLKSADRWNVLPVDANKVPVKEKENRFQWMKNILDNVETHQATIDARTRADFKEVAIAQGIGMIKKAKGMLEEVAVK